MDINTIKVQFETPRRGVESPSDCSNLEVIKEVGDKPFEAKDRNFLSIEANARVKLINCFVLKHVHSFKDGVFLINCTVDRVLAFGRIKLTDCTIHTIIHSENLIANRCFLRQVIVKETLTIEGCDVSGLTSGGQERIFVKNSRLQDVNANGDIYLTNSSANNLISDGEVEAKSKRGTTSVIESINAKKFVSLTRILAKNIVVSQGGLSAIQSTLSTVTAEGKVELEECSGETEIKKYLIEPKVIENTPNLLKSVDKVKALSQEPKMIISQIAPVNASNISSLITPKTSSSKSVKPEMLPRFEPQIVKVTSYEAEGGQFEDIVFERDIKLINCYVSGTVKSLKGNVELVECWTKNAVAKGMLILKNSHVELQASSETWFVKATGCTSLGEVEARTSVHLDGCEVTGTVACTEGDIKATNCSLQNVNGHGNITLSDSDAGNVTSNIGKVMIKTFKKDVKVKDVHAKNDVELNFDTAVNYVTTEDIHVSHGGLEAKKCKLANVTVLHKINLRSCSGKTIESREGRILSMGTESHHNQFSGMTAHGNIDLIFTDVDKLSLKSITGEILTDEVF